MFIRRIAFYWNVADPFALIDDFKIFRKDKVISKRINIGDATTYISCFWLASQLKSSQMVLRPFLNVHEMGLTVWLLWVTWECCNECTIIKNLKWLIFLAVMDIIPLQLVYHISSSIFRYFSVTRRAGVHIIGKNCLHIRHLCVIWQQPDWAKVFYIPFICSVCFHRDHVSRQWWFT